VSTRASVKFRDKNASVRVYHHADGYPEHMEAELDAFFAYCEGHLTWDNRFDDAEYLAARYVYWLTTAGFYLGVPWDGYSVGIQERLHGDESYGYVVHCMGTGRPLVDVIELEKEAK